MSANAQQIITLIEDAFGGVTLENGISLREAIVLDNYGTRKERRQARSQDELEDWSRIPDETIARCSSSLAFLDAKGMRFHLPAFMRFALRHYLRSDSESINYTIYQLDLLPDSASRDVDSVFKNTTEDQKAMLQNVMGPAEFKAQLKSVHTFKARKLTLLSEPQRKAVRSFLEFMAFEAADHVDSRAAARALRSFA
jgi:hypothetical protein